MKMCGGQKYLFKCLLLTVIFALLSACGGEDTLPLVQQTDITSARAAVFTEGSAGSFTVTATGIPTPALSLTGALPSGVTFDDATGVLGGTPDAGSAGVYPMVITATNGVPPNAVQQFTLAVVTPSTTALIVHGTSGIEGDAVTNLASIMTGAGLTVTANVGVPAGDLSGYAQIWDVRFFNVTPITAEDIASYTTYLTGGRTLVVIGGNNISFATRNNSVVALITALGGGTITIETPANTQDVQAPFTGPDPITSIGFVAAAGTANPGTGAFITKDGADIGAGLYYARNALSNTPAGRLMVVFDINFLQTGADEKSHTLTGNMVRLPQGRKSTLFAAKHSI